MQAFRITISAVGILMAATEARAQLNPVVVESGMPTARVNYADLDLTAPAGRLTLDRRVANAAANLCLDNQREPLEQLVLQHECYSTAMSRARIDIQHAVSNASRQLASRGSILVAAR
jgi:UrcA family protein